MKKKSFIISTVIMVLLVAALGSYVSYIIFYRRLSLQKQTVVVTIPAGANSHQIARILTEKHIIKHPFIFRSWARLQGSDRFMQAGDYAINSGQTINTLMQELYRGRGVQYQVRFIEGWVFLEIVHALNNHAKIKHLVSQKPPEWIMHQLGYSRKNPAGLFFPDTYNFSAGTTDLVILRRAYDKMQRVVHRLWVKRDEDLPYKTPYQAIIMASLIEAEAAKASERKMIASVLINRLRKKMRLQADPSVTYGLFQALGITLARADLKIDTPYNTYIHKGLPPTPICMPSAASLQAAMHPARSDYYYYVAKSDGYHKFSKTYAEHRKAIEKYLLHRGD